MGDRQPNIVPVDYDSDPGRCRAVGQATARYSLVADVHEDVADRLAREDHTPVLDVGCGHGRLLAMLRQRGTRAVGLDGSPSQLSRASGPRVRGDATRLPFPDASFGGAAALYMLYHVPDPT